MHSSTVSGVIMALAAAVLWGSTGTAQSFLPTGFPPYWVGALRLVVAAAFFAVLIAVPRSGRPPPELLAIARTPAFWTATLAIGCYNLSFFAGVSQLGVAVGTAVALGSGPIWAGLLEGMMDRRLPSRTWWSSTALATVGIALVMASGDAARTPTVSGIVLCLMAGLSYAAYALSNRRLVMRYSPRSVTALVFITAAGIALLAVLVFLDVPAVASSDLLVLAWLGIASTGVAYLLFSRALQSISSATAVTLALAEPVTAFILAVLIVGEVPATLAYVGLAAVMLGLVGVVHAENKRPAAS